jgi:hypothetical protein
VFVLLTAYIFLDVPFYFFFHVWELVVPLYEFHRPGYSLISEYFFVVMLSYDFFVEFFW